jgi:multiple sugar transport system substrate-binding protein
MKRTICSLLAAGMVITSLAGCSGSNRTAEPTKAAENTEQNSTNGGSEGSQAENSAGEGTEKPYAGTTIRVLSMTGQISDAMEEYLDRFEEETGIKVNMELYGEAQLREKCTTEFLAGSSTIDAFLMSPLQDMTAFSNNGWVEPLDSYLEDPDFDWEDFASAPMEQIKIKSTGETGALPLYSSVQLMFYRKDVFEEKGIKPPTTYDELIAACEAINNPEDNFYGIACRGEKIALTSQFSPFLFGYGGAYFKDGVCAFRETETIDAAKFYGKLLGTYAPEGILTAGYSQMTQLFNAGQVGMCIDAIALYQTLIDSNESAFFDKVGVAPIPEGPAGRQSYKQVVWGASIYSGSKNKEAAWEFLKFTAGKDIAAEITPKGMPTFRASVWEDERVTSTMPEDYIEAYNTEIQADTTNQYGLPRMTAVSEARDAMGEAIVYSIETKGEGAEIENRMKAAADRVDQLLKDAGEYGEDYPYVE